jgi:hypothetical protein
MHPGQKYFNRISGQTVHQVGEEHQLPDGQRVVVTYQPPIQLWREGAKPGDQWETAFQKTVQRGKPGGSSGATSTTPGGATITLDRLLADLIEGIFSATSPPREGADAVKVNVGPIEKISTLLGDADGQRIEFRRGTLSIVDWHVPGMGLVKRVQVSPKERLEAMLVEYSVPQ